MILLTTVLISMFITIVLIPIFRLLAVRLNILDVPNARKAHDIPIPKSGGIAVVLGAIIPVVLWAPIDTQGWAIILGVGVLFIFGMLDDWKNLNYKYKFSGQLIAALIVIFFGGIKINTLGTLLPEDVLLPDLVAIPLTAVAIIGVTNAINLADGLDGLAGGICLFSFICIGYLAFRSENIILALLAVATVGALFGFLRFNTHPAVLFMGDTGAQFLGFTVITLALGLTQDNTPYSCLLPLFLIGFPIIDTLTVMTERIVNGKSPFIADKNHFHHKLMHLNLSHTEAVFFIYIFQAILVTLAFLFRFYSEWFLLILFFSFSLIILLGFLVTNRFGWKLKRENSLGRFIPKKLSSLRQSILPIKISFKTVQYGIPLILIITTLIIGNIPEYFSYFSLGLIALILATRLSGKIRDIGGLRLVLYLFIPFSVYQANVNQPEWVADWFLTAYNISFPIIAAFIVLTLILSRRDGFKATPMDFIILFVALIVPNLPDFQIQDYHMGLVAGKIIVLFFGYDILLGELRGELKKVGGLTFTAMLIVVVKGFLL